MFGYNIKMVTRCSVDSCTVAAVGAEPSQRVPSQYWTSRGGMHLTNINFDKLPAMATTVQWIDVENKCFSKNNWQIRTLVSQ